MLVVCVGFTCWCVCAGCLRWFHVVIPCSLYVLVLGACVMRWSCMLAFLYQFNVVALRRGFMYVFCDGVLRWFHVLVSCAGLICECYVIAVLRWIYVLVVFTGFMQVLCVGVLCWFHLLALCVCVSMSVLCAAAMRCAWPICL